MLSTIRLLFILFAVTLSTSPYALEVTKDDWVRAMSTALPTAFCNPQQYFRQCFTVSAQECEETAATATRVCLNSYKDKLPQILHQPQDGTHWGTIIGRCAGEAYGITFTKKFINNARCNDVTQWQ